MQQEQNSKVWQSCWGVEKKVILHQKNTRGEELKYKHCFLNLKIQCNLI